MIWWMFRAKFIFLCFFLRNAQVSEVSAAETGVLDGLVSFAYLKRLFEFQVKALLSLGFSVNWLLFKVLMVVFVRSSVIYAEEEG